MTRLLVLLGRGEHADEDQLFRTFIGRELTKRRVAVVIASLKIVYEVGLHLLSPAGIGQRVWRAALEHGGPEPHMEKRFMLAAACLMERLDADGVLAPRRDDQ